MDRETNFRCKNDESESTSDGGLILARALLRREGAKTRVRAYKHTKRYRARGGNFAGRALCDYPGLIRG